MHLPDPSSSATGATIVDMAADAALPDPTAFAIAGSNRTRARKKLKGD
jgi:hypothetical protein